MNHHQCREGLQGTEDDLSTTGEKKTTRTTLGYLNIFPIHQYKITQNPLKSATFLRNSWASLVAFLSPLLFSFEPLEYENPVQVGESRKMMLAT